VGGGVYVLCVGFGGVAGRVAETTIVAPRRATPLVPPPRQYRSLAASAHIVHSYAHDLALANATPTAAARSPLRPAVDEARASLVWSLDGYALALVAQTRFLPVVALARRLRSAYASIVSLHEADGDDDDTHPPSSPPPSYDVRFYRGRASSRARQCSDSPWQRPAARTHRRLQVQGCEREPSQPEAVSVPGRPWHPASSVAALLTTSNPSQLKASPHGAW